MQRPKPPPSYYKVMMPSGHHPLRDCPYCKSDAPFIFSEDSLNFQDKKAQHAYERYLRDDLEWYNLSLIALCCGLSLDEFEKIHEARPYCDGREYMVDGIALTLHWSRYMEGVCAQCGTKIWHDLGAPPHYYYQPPRPEQLSLPLSSVGGTAVFLTNKTKKRCGDKPFKT